MTTAELELRPDTRVHGWVCLCHFSSGADGVYVVEREQLLRGTITPIAGLAGTWTVTEMVAPDQAEVIDAEIWVRRATAEELEGTAK
jgi:hypothetical protein